MADYEMTYESDSVGSVKIADDALASIAALAATEVEGVCGMVGNITNELIAKLGVRNLSRGVKLDVQEDNVSISLSLILRYGYSIPSVSADVQEKVKLMVENMTGLKVSDVSITIAGISADV